jgi:hypothetical protein
MAIAQDRPAAHTWLRTHRDGLLAAVRVARARQLHTLAWQLTDTLWPLLTGWCTVQDWVAIERLGLAAAKQSGNAAAQRRLLNSGAQALQAAGQSEESLHWYTRALECARRDLDGYEVTQALTGLAEGYRLTGHPDQAQPVLLELLQLHQQHASTAAATRVQIALGDVELALGHPKNAAAFLTTALAGLGTDEVLDTAHLRAVLARAALLLGQPQQARDLVGQVLEHLGDSSTDPWTVYCRQTLAHLDQVGTPAPSPAPVVLLSDLQPW